MPGVSWMLSPVKTDRVHRFHRDVIRFCGLCAEDNVTYAHLLLANWRCRNDKCCMGLNRNKTNIGSPVF